MKIREEMQPSELKAYLLATAAAQAERAQQLRAVASSELDSANACERASHQLYREAEAIIIIDEAPILWAGDEPPAGWEFAETSVEDVAVLDWTV